MSFETEMTKRFGERNMKQWTNPGQSTNIATINSDAVDAALEDTKGDFREMAGVEYDETDSRMLGRACRRARFHLLQNGGQGGSLDKLDERTSKAIGDLRKVTNANRLVPSKKKIDPSSTNYTRTLNGLGFCTDARGGYRSPADRF